MRREIEREEEVYLQSEDDIEKLATAIEACQSDLPDEVGPGFKSIPAGCQLLLGLEAPSSISSVQDLRAEAAMLVRSHELRMPIGVKFRPVRTARAPPLDRFGNSLMHFSDGGFKTLDKILSTRHIRTTEEARDLLLLQLWDALFHGFPKDLRNQVCFR